MTSPTILSHKREETGEQATFREKFYSALSDQPLKSGIEEMSPSIPKSLRASENNYHE